MTFEKIVIVTRKTRLQELVERFNTQRQAQFYIEHAGGNFNDYVVEDETYQKSLDAIRQAMEVGLKLQVIDRSYLPTFLFSERDVIVTVGQDGLVANCAKYVGQQPIVALNPDPSRFDGVLLPFQVHQAKQVIHAVLSGKSRHAEITLAEVKLNDGQRLLAFNDFFIGPRSHTSARYRLSCGEHSESQSSSGIIVSTGAGSTGWLSSIFNMCRGIAGFMGTEFPTRIEMEWSDPRLIFAVREPFISRASRAEIVGGWIEPEHPLQLESFMPTDGVIFSDGIEADYLAFNSGAIASIRAADQRAHLVTQ